MTQKTHKERIRHLASKENVALALAIGSTILSIFVFAKKEGREARREVIAGSVVAETIAAQRILLADSEGNLIGQLCVDSEHGAGELLLHDRAGNIRFHLSSGSEESGFSMYSPGDELGATIAVDAEGKGHLHLLNGNEQASVSLITLDNAAGGICTSNSRGEIVTGLGPGSDNGGELGLSEKGETMRRVSELFSPTDSETDGPQDKPVALKRR